VSEPDSEGEMRGSASADNDRPLKGKEDIERPDRLGYSAYAAALFQLITNQDTGLPISLAVSAPWGYGKTSIMNWVKTELDMHREGEEHKCRMVPDFPGRPDWLKRKLAVEQEEHAGTLGLTRLRCKTVWIDAWKYESSAALWAAFTKEIYQQGQQQLDGKLNGYFSRLKFRLALANSKPGETALTWWEVLRAVYKKNWFMVFLVLFVGTVIGFLPNIVPAIEEIVSHLVTTIVALLAAVSGIYSWIKGLRRQPFSFDLNKVTAATQELPEPVDGVNAPRDIERLVELLAPGENDALVVFIDDLDRCSPDKVKDAVEAINLLFNGPQESKMVFVVGMDAVMVAASLHVAYGDMVQELERRDHPAGTDFGHRFLGKICQLSFNLPPPQETSMQDYLNGLMGVPGDVGTVREGPDSREFQMTMERKEELETQLNTAIKGKQSDTALLEALEAVVNKAPEVERETVKEEALERARGETLKELRKDSPKVQEAIRIGARFLESRPRDYKRFINAVRLQLLVHNQSLNLGGRTRATPDQIAKWTALCIRWPVLAEELRKRSELLQEIEDWAEQNTDPLDHWQNRIKSLAGDPDFKQAFNMVPKLGNADLHGLLIVQ